MIERVSYKLGLLGATGAQFCWNSLKMPIECTSELSAGGSKGAGINQLDFIPHHLRLTHNYHVVFKCTQGANWSLEAESERDIMQLR